MWVNMPNEKGPERTEGTSRVRDCEARYIVDLIKKHIKSSVGESLSYGVISFYSEQVKLIKRLLKGYDVMFYERRKAAYVCDCSRQRVERALISVGRDELQDMIDEGRPIEVNCQFCGKHYSFTVRDLKEMLLRANK